MWKDLDFRQMEMEAGSFIKAPARSSKEIEGIIVLSRFSLYNSGKNYGSGAIAIWMKNRAGNPVPSVRKISNILKKNQLINKRTGQYCC